MITGTQDIEMEKMKGKKEWRSWVMVLMREKCVKCVFTLEELAFRGDIKIYYKLWFLVFNLFNYIIETNHLSDPN